MAEEGLDIPEANCVIYFDPINHAVSYVQGRGRARQEGSTFVVLDQRDDRPTALLAQQETEQHTIASTISPQHITDPAARARAQRDRERSARPILSTGITEDTAMAKLHHYCQKTKVACDETCTKLRNSPIMFQVELSYCSVLRRVKATGRGASKKAAKRQAAIALLAKVLGTHG